jgi:hypothetical protein
MGDYVGFRVDLDVMAECKIPDPTGNEISDLPSSDQSLFWLR